MTTNLWEAAATVAVTLALAVPGACYVAWCVRHRAEYPSDRPRRTP